MRPNSSPPTLDQWPESSFDSFDSQMPKNVNPAATTVTTASTTTELIEMAISVSTPQVYLTDVAGDRDTGGDAGGGNDREGRER